jgi:hypothetical protein
MKKPGPLSRITGLHPLTKLPTREYSPNQQPINKLGKKPTKEGKVIHRFTLCG